MTTATRPAYTTETELAAIVTALAALPEIECPDSGSDYGTGAHTITFGLHEIVFHVMLAHDDGYIASFDSPGAVFILAAPEDGFVEFDLGVIVTAELIADTALRISLAIGG